MRWPKPKYWSGQSQRKKGGPQWGAAIGRPSPHGGGCLRRLRLTNETHWNFKCKRNGVYFWFWFPLSPFGMGPESPKGPTGPYGPMGPYAPIGPMGPRGPWRPNRRPSGRPVNVFFRLFRCTSDYHGLFLTVFKQEDMFHCWARRHVFLSNRKTCFLFGQADSSSRSTITPSCWPRTHICSFNHKTCLSVQRDDMSANYNTNKCILVFIRQVCVSKTINYSVIFEVIPMY